jgi:hypothetical protein
MTTVWASAAAWLQAVPQAVMETMALIADVALKALPTSATAGVGRLQASGDKRVTLVMEWARAGARLYRKTPMTAASRTCA